jgi:hypothetical protein
MASAQKHALEDLLRTHRLQPALPPLHGEDRRLRALTTGSSEVNELAGGGFARGEISQLHGPRSSGRTALALSSAASVTREGALVAWVDPADQLDPASAAAAGVELARLLWIRGAPSLRRAASATSTLLGSGLFDLVVLDLLGTTEPERRALPGTTWIRMHRMIEGTPTALLLLCDTPLARSARGATISLHAARAAWSGPPGPGRLLASLAGGAERVETRRPRVSFSRR